MTTPFPHCFKSEILSLKIKKFYLETGIKDNDEQLWQARRHKNGNLERKSREIEETYFFISSSNNYPLYGVLVLHEFYILQV